MPLSSTDAHLDRLIGGTKHPCKVLCHCPTGRYCDPVDSRAVVRRDSFTGCYSFARHMSSGLDAHGRSIFWKTIRTYQSRGVHCPTPGGPVDAPARDLPAHLQQCRAPPSSPAQTARRSGPSNMKIAVSCEPLLSPGNRLKSRPLMYCQVLSILRVTNASAAVIPKIE